MRGLRPAGQSIFAEGLALAGGGLVAGEIDDHVMAAGARQLQRDAASDAARSACDQCQGGHGGE